MFLRALIFGISLAATASRACDLALVLAVDVSGSVDSREYDIQMQGLAAALRERGMHCFVKWNHLFPIPPLCISEAELRDAAHLADVDTWDMIDRIAEELGIHLMAAGHYNSERFGPEALGSYLNRHLDIPVDFVEIPNDV